jgi:hypothetical protein
MIGQFNVFPSLVGSYAGTTVSFPRLVEMLKTPNGFVSAARHHGKGSPKFADIKMNGIPIFSPNSFTHLNIKTNRNNAKVKRVSTGFIFLDFDFYSQAMGIESAKAKALLFKAWLIKNKHIALCWLSLSETGVGALVTVRKCYGKVQFEYYWQCLNLLFGKQVDPATCRWNQYCVISHDEDLFVNELAIPIDGDFPYRIRYNTYLSYNAYSSINDPVLLTKGQPYIRVDIIKYKKGISEGSRNNVLGFQTAKLIIVNQGLSQDQVLYRVLKWNNLYCKPPLTREEVTAVVNNNYQRWSDCGAKDISQFYYKKKGSDVPALKRVWFSPFCTLTKGEKQRKRQYLLDQGKDWTEQAIRKAVGQLKKGRIKITKETISIAICKSTSTVREYWKPFKDEIAQHNNSLRGVNMCYYDTGHDNNRIVSTTSPLPARCC